MDNDVRELVYWVVERNKGEFLVYTDDRYWWLYASPELFNDYTEAQDLATTRGGIVKKVILRFVEEE